MPPRMCNRYIIQYIPNTYKISCLKPPGFKFGSKSKRVLSRKSQFQLEYGPRFKTSFNLGAHCLSEAGQARCAVPSGADQPRNHCTAVLQDGA